MLGTRSRAPRVRAGRALGGGWPRAGEPRAASIPSPQAGIRRPDGWDGVGVPGLQIGVRAGRPGRPGYSPPTDPGASPTTPSVPGATSRKARFGAKRPLALRPGLGCPAWGVGEARAQSPGRRGPGSAAPLSPESTTRRGSVPPPPRPGLGDLPRPPREASCNTRSLEARETLAGRRLPPPKGDLKPADLSYTEAASTWTDRDARLAVGERATRRPQSR